MSDASTCASCGRPFSVPDDVIARFPGWKPTRCRRCHSRKTAGSGARGGRRQGATEESETGPEDGVFTDGSSSPNPGPGGWGVVWVRDGAVVTERQGRVDEETTNNRMELTALIEAYRLIPSGTAVTVHSDSDLCVRTVNEWAARWAKAGWRRKSGPVKNLDLVKQLYELALDHPDVSLRWVPAHSGWTWNERADALASGEATAAPDPP